MTATKTILTVHLKDLEEDFEVQPYESIEETAAKHDAWTLRTYFICEVCGKKENVVGKWPSYQVMGEINSTGVDSEITTVDCCSKECASIALEKLP